MDIFKVFSSNPDQTPSQNDLIQFRILKNIITSEERGREGGGGRWISTLGKNLKRCGRGR